MKEIPKVQGQYFLFIEMLEKYADLSLRRGSRTRRVQSLSQLLLNDGEGLLCVSTFGLNKDRYEHLGIFTFRESFREKN